MSEPKWITEGLCPRCETKLNDDMSCACQTNIKGLVVPNEVVQLKPWTGSGSIRSGKANVCIQIQIRDLDVELVGPNSSIDEDGTRVALLKYATIPRPDRDPDPPRSIADYVRETFYLGEAVRRGGAGVSLAAFCDVAGRIERDHGFGNQSFGEDMALIHSEVSEALEAYRETHGVGGWYDHKFDRGGLMVAESSSDPELNGVLGKPQGVPAELADVLIRIFAMCSRYNIDIDKAVREKMAYNETRPARHGNKAL